MRLSQSACSQQQRKGGGEELMETSQSMLLYMWARPMCMRMLVRMRGYVSTSSYPALRTPARAYVDTAAAAGGGRVFMCKSARRAESPECGRVGGTGRGERTSWNDERVGWSDKSTTI